MIALAAGRTPVVKYLKEAEDRYSGEKPPRAERKYCKAFYLRDLRKYPAWSESRTNWKKRRGNSHGNGDHGGEDEPFTDETVVFIHQDFTVTESVWQNENVIFNGVDSAWKEFCTDNLQFKVPDDLDLIVPNEDLIATQ
jgi:hypothetical protein